MSYLKDPFAKTRSFNQLSEKAKAEFGFDNFTYVGFCRKPQPSENQYKELYQWYKNYIKNYGYFELEKNLVDRKLKIILPKNFKWVKPISELH